MFPACSRFYPRCRLLLAGRFCSRADHPELVALRHQLNVLRRQRPGCPRLFCSDRLLRVWLYLLWPRCVLAEQRLHLVCGSDRNSPRFVAPRRYWFLPPLKFGSDGIFSKDRPRLFAIWFAAVAFARSARHDFRLKADRRGQRCRDQTRLFAFFEHPHCFISICARRELESWAKNDFRKTGRTILAIEGALARELQGFELQF